jgi:ABC-type multidrug transport system fused ATPase/permease subunit
LFDICVRSPLRLTSILARLGSYVGGSVSGLTGFFTGLMKGVGAGTRVFELLDRVPTISATAGEVLNKNRNGDIVFHGTTFAYPSRPGVKVLNEVDLKIERGTSVAIVYVRLHFISDLRAEADTCVRDLSGPSGSGKSSFHGLLLRYYDPDQGYITFDGDDIRSFTTESWRDKLGIVPQDPPLFTGTVFENIAYGTPAATEEDVIRAARSANCEFVFDLPEGLQTMVGKASLSGGQKQRSASLSPPPPFVRHVCC